MLPACCIYIEAKASVLERYARCEDLSLTGMATRDPYVIRCRPLHRSFTHSLWAKE